MTTPGDDLLTAHSIAEARLYLRAVGCPQCHGGSLQDESVVVEEVHIDSIVRLDCYCSACDHRLGLRFRIDSEWVMECDPPLLNPGSAPSALMDVAQWLTLHHALLEQSQQESDRRAALLLGHQAGLCIDEALKFFEPDNDLPPPGAFFGAQALEHARRQPQFFTRQRLLELRSKLPNLGSSPARKPAQAARRRWWEFWRPRDVADEGYPPTV